MLKTSVNSVQEVKIGVSMKMFSAPIHNVNLGLNLIDINEDTADKLLLNKTYAHLGRLHIIPVSFRKELSNVGSNVRNSFKRKAVPYRWGRSTKYFMTEEMLDSFKVELQEHETQFYGIWENILNDYDRIIDDFLSLFDRTVTMRSSRSALLKHMRSVIPLKAELRDGFKISLETYSTNHVAERDDIVNRFLGKSLAISTDLVSSMVDAYPKAPAIKKRIVTHVTKRIPDIHETNIQLDSNIGDIVQRIVSVMDADFFDKEAVFRSGVEQIRQSIYDYALELDVLDMLR